MLLGFVGFGMAAVAHWGVGAAFVGNGVQSCSWLLLCYSEM